MNNCYLSGPHDMHKKQSFHMGIGWESFRLNASCGDKEYISCIQNSACLGPVALLLRFIPRSRKVCWRSDSQDFQNFQIQMLCDKYGQEILAEQLFQWKSVFL